MFRCVVCDKRSNVGIHDVWDLNDIVIHEFIKDYLLLPKFDGYWELD